MHYIMSASVYTQAIARANRLYLTLVDDDAQGDTFFPEYQHLPSSLQSEEHHAGTPPYTHKRTPSGVLFAVSYGARR
jgi:dihydrofolate reductase